MTLSAEAILAVRMRLERQSIAFLAGNPLRSDPKGARLARRIARVADWCGPDLWQCLTSIVHFRLTEVVKGRLAGL